MAKIHDLSVRRGESFKLTVRWETEPWVYAPIVSISSTAPVRFTTAVHTIPNGWNVAVVDAKGMTQLNAVNNPPKPKDMRRATVLTATSVEFNDTSAAAFGAHKPNTGYLAWLTPHSLDDFTARMQIKDRVGGNTLHTVTSAPLGGIVLSDAEKTIEIEFSATTTEDFLWSRGVYDLELISAGGTVFALLEGAVTIGAEVTTIT